MLLIVSFSEALPAGAQGFDPLQLGLVPVGKKVPEFGLPPVQGRSLGLANQHLEGGVSLVNVFASWCAACLDEHPMLMDLAERKVVPIHGLNYKDMPDNAQRWLQRLGDPYTRTGVDRDGRVATNFGLFGVPQTFVVTAEGRIAYLHVGALSKRDIRETILPIVEKLRSQQPSKNPSASDRQHGSPTDRQRDGAP